MLGELARWLRLLGYDTSYSKDINDEELMEHAKKENRVLVTCDQDLHSRAVKSGVCTLLLKPDSLVNRLALLARTFELELKVSPEDSRCPICNGEITKVDNIAKLIGRVPSKVLDAKKEFWICKVCGQIYWVGGHWKNIAKTINNVKQLMR
jgi:hypothetical protein